MCCASSINCLVVLEQNSSRHTATAGMVVSYGPEIMRVLKNMTLHGERLVRCVLKIQGDTHSRLLPLLINMLPFTDDIHKRFVIFYHCMSKL